MRWILLAASAFNLVLWITFGSFSSQMGMPIPALGSFFDPAQGFWRNAQPMLTEVPSGKISIDHPNVQGTVHYDERGVPHIFAPDVASAVFIQGYITARDRLWQMDISSRSTGGRLSEILGERTRNRDTRQIRHGYRAAARQTVRDWQNLFPEDYDLIQEYAAGVNAFMSQINPADYPVEYKVLGYQPEPWTPYHSALIVKGMVQSMTDRSQDVQSQYTFDSIGLATFNQLFPMLNELQTPIVPSGTVFQFDSAALRPPAELPEITGNPALSSSRTFTPNATSGEFPFDYHPNNGSNNWAVAGTKSPTGKPLLASDPHLGLSLPSIWYEIQIHTPEVNCRGVSLPGLPLIVIGFNESIAWGMTNGSVDVLDWFKLDWQDDTFNSYQVDGSVLEVVNATDTLYVKGSKPETITTPWSIWGPITNTSDSSSAFYGLAKRHIGMLNPKDRDGSDISAFLGAMGAGNYAEFKAAMKNYAAPIMNFAFAAQDGDISILSNGYYPLRGNDESRFIRDGSQSDQAWIGYIPFEHLPESLNPRRGFVSSANQRQTDAAYPYFYDGRFAAWRGRYINRRLAQLRSAGQREMKELQMDAHSILAEELTPLLLARINRSQLDETGRALFQLLAEWDYSFTAESKAATLFDEWRRRLYQLTVDELRREDGQLGLKTWHWVSLLRRAPNHPIFDIQATELTETAAILTQRVFDEIHEEWTVDNIPLWYEERNSEIRHLGLIPGFGTGLLKSNGHFSAPNATNGGHGPSWRMVVELGDQPRAWGVLPGGPSGNPGSPTYDAGVEEWVKGRYYELELWPDEAMAANKASATLVFTRQ